MSSESAKQWSISYRARGSRPRYTEMNVHYTSTHLSPQEQPLARDLDDVHKLTLDEMLCRCERGWDYRGALADLDGEEKAFLATLAKAKGSWLQVNV